MHVDVCTKMSLFGWNGPPAPGAERAARAVQVPVYESLSDQEIERVGRLLREQVVRLAGTADLTAIDPQAAFSDAECFAPPARRMESTSAGRSPRRPPGGDVSARTAIR